MYKINKSLVLKQQNILSSAAYAAAPKNSSFNKQTLEESRQPAGSSTIDVGELAKVSSSQLEYQVNLWNSLTAPNPANSIFAAAKKAWSDRKN